HGQVRGDCPRDHGFLDKRAHHVRGPGEARRLQVEGFRWLDSLVHVDLPARTRGATESHKESKTSALLEKVTTIPRGSNGAREAPIFDSRQSSNESTLLGKPGIGCRRVVRDPARGAAFH